MIYLDDTTIQEVVLINKIMSVLSTEIFDIAFIIKADEVKHFLSEYYRRVNVFLTYYEKKHRERHILCPIKTW